MDAPNIPGLPHGKKGLLIAGGVLAVAIGGIYIYKSRSAAADSNGSDSGGSFGAGPALLYSPPAISSSGNSVSGGITPGTGPSGGGVPTIDQILAALTGTSVTGTAPGTLDGPAGGIGPSGLSLFDVMKMQGENDFTLGGRALDLSFLQTLGLVAGNTADLSHTDTGTHLVTTGGTGTNTNGGTNNTVNGQPIWTGGGAVPYGYAGYSGAALSSGNIRSFIDDQIAHGVTVNAATIGQWMSQYGVSKNQVGAAYGLDAAGTDQWLASHPAVTLTNSQGTNGGTSQGGTNTGGQSQTGTGGTGGTGGNAAAQQFFDLGGGHFRVIAGAGAAAPNRGLSFSDDDIRNYVNDQASHGSMLNATTIQSWSQYFGVGTDYIGKAFGMDSSQTAAWLAANPGAHQ